MYKIYATATELCHTTGRLRRYCAPLPGTRRDGYLIAVVHMQSVFITPPPTTTHQQGIDDAPAYYDLNYDYYINLIFITLFRITLQR